MKGIALTAAALLLATAACHREAAEYEARRPALGTVVTARAVAGDGETARAAVEAAFEAIAHAEYVASNYDPASEVTRMNYPKFQGPVKVSVNLYEIVSLAYEMAEVTDGYFDPTVAPVVEAYGIKEKAPRWPDDEELAEIMEKVGYRGLELNEKDRTVTFARPGMRVDLSGIAKGWAVDRAVEAMAAAGARAGLVEAGGEVACFGGGPKAGGKWRLGIQHPDRDGLYATFELATGTCATSGPYSQRYEAGGHEFSHLFDPRTGRPVEGPAGVTVVAPTCAEADAWATALAVMPTAEVTRLLKPGEGPACLILRRRGLNLESDLRGDMPEINVVKPSGR